MVIETAMRAAGGAVHNDGRVPALDVESSLAAVWH